MLETICPVPINQRPLNEYNGIANSWIISWPLLESTQFYRNLLYSWFLIMPISLTISYGSDYLKNNVFDFLLISLTGSLLLPLLLLFRQWLSWKYIFKRLSSENIEYEESGWYDGQIWEKPVEWRAKDLLIANHQVKPILKHIKRVLTLIIVVIFTAFSFIFLSVNL